MVDPIQDELHKILDDLGRISDLVAQKESELGLIKDIDLKAYEDAIYELVLDEYSFFLDGDQIQKLAQLLKALNV